MPDIEYVHVCLYMHTHITLGVAVRVCDTLVCLLMVSLVAGFRYLWTCILRFLVVTLVYEVQ